MVMNLIQPQRWNMKLVYYETLRKKGMRGYEVMDMPFYSVFSNFYSSSPPPVSRVGWIKTTTILLHLLCFCLVVFTWAVLSLRE